MSLFRTYNPGRDTGWGRRGPVVPPPLTMAPHIPDRDLPAATKAALRRAIWAAVGDGRLKIGSACCSWATKLAFCLGDRVALNRALRRDFIVRRLEELRVEIEAVATVVPEVELVVTWIREDETNPGCSAAR